MTPSLGQLLRQARMHRAADAPIYLDIAHCAYLARISPTRVLDFEYGFQRPTEAELMALCVALCIVGRPFAALMDAYGRQEDAA